MDSQASNAERTARYLHEEKLKNQENGEADKKMACRWFLGPFVLLRQYVVVVHVDVAGGCGGECHRLTVLSFDPYQRLANQMEHFYRYGQVDECKFTWKNMYLCYRASMMDEEKREDFLKDTPLDASNGPQITDVWEKKETPGW